MPCSLKECRRKREEGTPCKFHLALPRKRVIFKYATGYYPTFIQKLPSKFTKTKKVTSTQTVHSNYAPILSTEIYLLYLTLGATHDITTIIMKKTTVDNNGKNNNNGENYRIIIIKHPFAVVNRSCNNGWKECNEPRKAVAYVWGGVLWAANHSEISSIHCTYIAYK